jgi:hypothetical protein
MSANPPVPIGYATLTAQSQQFPVNPAAVAIIAGATCTLIGAYFSESGAPITPQGVYWSLNDQLTGQNIVPWTGVTPGNTNRIIVPATANAMISKSRTSETKVALLRVTDQSGNTVYAKATYDVLAQGA